MVKGYKVNGLASLQSKLKKLPDNIKKELIQDIEDAADTIVMKAVQLAPVDFGVLKQSIGNQAKSKGLNYIIFVNADYAPYVEFGTGTLVDVPNELESYAMQFKGKGMKQVNLPARPFFFPGFFEERTKLVQKLIKDINKHL